MDISNNKSKCDHCNFIDILLSSYGRKISCDTIKIYISQELNTSCYCNDPVLKTKIYYTEKWKDLITKRIKLQLKMRGKIFSIYVITEKPSDFIRKRNNNGNIKCIPVFRFYEDYDPCNYLERIKIFNNLKNKLIIKKLEGTKIRDVEQIIEEIHETLIKNCINKRKRE